MWLRIYQWLDGRTFQPVVKNGWLHFVPASGSKDVAWIIAHSSAPYK